MAVPASALRQFKAGTLSDGYRYFGAHPGELEGACGVRFTVWAPNARRVSVVGDFNRWNRYRNPLEPLDGTGIWQGFIAGVETGARYKFALQPLNSRRWRQHADPYAAAAELRPQNSSIVADLGAHTWHDDEWIAQRERSDLDRPISVYEVHLGSWRRSRTGFPRYRQLAHELVPYIRALGFTHVELLPVAEHPLDMSWGYQTTGYFAPTARFGAPTDFMYFVDYFHQHGIGVILDWVPAHFPRDAFGLARFDGTPLYEHADPMRGEHPDWGTYIFDYGRPEVSSFLVSSATSWFDRYHVDGLRVDAVASMLYLDYSRSKGEWLPNRLGGKENLEAIEVIRRINAAVHERFAGALMIAEDSTLFPGVTVDLVSGGLGFDLKWNLGWMHDVLQYMERDPIYRSYHQRDFTLPASYGFLERFLLPLSHDEVVHGKRSLLEKMPGDTWQKFANLRLLYAAMWGQPGKKLLFMGGEFGQRREWGFERSLDWELRSGDDGPFHKGMQRLVRDLNDLYRNCVSLHSTDCDPDGFDWIDYSDAAISVFAFSRRSRDRSGVALFLLNMTPVVRYGYRVGLPDGGPIHEAISTDAIRYGGSGVGNRGEIPVQAIRRHNRPYSAVLTLPPLGASILLPGRPRDRQTDQANPIT